MSAREVYPQVYITSTMTPNLGAMRSYLLDIGAHDWDFADSTGDLIDPGEYRSPNDVEKIIEFAGRLCYKSFGVGLNPNITKVRNNPKDYIGNIIKSGHGSVLEHVHIGFTLHNVSRVFTHELVRHRHGNFSQESMRYVRYTEIPFMPPRSFSTLLPPSLMQPDTPMQAKLDFWADQLRKNGNRMALMGQWQEELAADWEIDDIKDFHTKKLLTSDFRRTIPQGVATEIMWTTNLRELRHVIEQRTSLGAETEIREVFAIIAAACKARFPKAFADFNMIRNPKDPFDLPEWSAANKKV